jgi:PEGA domain-containing protein
MSIPSRTASCTAACLSLAAASVVTGCASVFGSKHHDFTFDTQPAAAQVVVDGTPVGNTPVVVSLSNTRAHTVVFKKQGYEEIGCEIQKSTGAGWVVLDILTGLVAVVVDAVTGDWAHNTTYECVQTMQPLVVEPAVAGAAPIATPGPAAQVAAPPQPRIVAAGKVKHADLVVADTAAADPGNGNRVVVAPTPHQSASQPPAAGLVASEPIGAPKSEAAAAAARAEYKAGRSHLARHEWQDAESSFRRAIALDGSVAAYHADLGEVLIVGDRWDEAEAAFTAAVLLDVDNERYRERLKQARSHRDD